jgi:hypothetical protein
MFECSSKEVDDLSGKDADVGRTSPGLQGAGSMRPHTVARKLRHGRLLAGTTPSAPKRVLAFEEQLVDMNRQRVKVAGGMPQRRAEICPGQLGREEFWTMYSTIETLPGKGIRHLHRVTIDQCDACFARHPHIALVEVADHDIGV